MREKAGSLASANLGWVTTEQLQRIIAERITASYIYRLDYRPQSDVATFNVIIEVPRLRSGALARVAGI